MQPITEFADAWEFWIDVGGTFTDCIARLPSGELRSCKVLSNGVTKGIAEPGSTARRVIDAMRRIDPPGIWVGFSLRVLDAQGQIGDETHVVGFDAEAGVLELHPPLTRLPAEGASYELTAGVDASLLAIRYLRGLPLTEPIPPCLVRCGTTRGTNALLTRQGARTAFVTTQGFGDILKIGNQNRPHLFELTIRKPTPLFERVIEAEERVAADGAVLTPLKEQRLREDLSHARQAGIESLAICFLHAYLAPGHEQIAARIARETGFTEVSVSHMVSPLIKLVPRGDTTVLDAYLNPVLRRYVEHLQAQLPGSQVRMMTSAGGLVVPERFTGKESVLSGPAGGAVAVGRVATRAGFSRAIGFDMGGTSTDVCRYDGRLELQYEQEKAGVRMSTPMLAVETVAAGGGSICRFDGVKVVVGPESAGADPGPACYGRGGPLTITDLNLYLGRIALSHFPFVLSLSAVERRLLELQSDVRRGTGQELALPALAQGCLDIANANMAAAIRKVSLAKGYDPRDYLLVAFGGAAGQHACDVADALGIRQILVHPQASLLSALGIGLADITRHRVAPIYQPWSSELLPELEAQWRRLAQETSAELQQEIAQDEPLIVERTIELRYRGMDQPLALVVTGTTDCPTEFQKEHQRLYGYVHADRPLEVVTLRVSVTAKRKLNLATRSAWVIHESAAADDAALIVDPNTSVIAPAGWSYEVRQQGELLLSRKDVRERGQVARSSFETADPMQLEVFNNLFTGIAEQMGITLRNTCSSVNVKERLDFSCALFTAEGDLVVNAPHIPVHLGAMAATVKRILLDNPDIAPGDVFVTNDPYRGGSHLPDVTVITPVFDQPIAADGKSTSLRFFTASRAHHAEIGGITPGSMPPFSTNLEEEGVLIGNFRVIAGGRPRLEDLRALLLSGPYPTRAVADNLADITAQIAANAQGAGDLERLVAKYSWPMTDAYMRHIRAAAEEKTLQALGKLVFGSSRFLDHLDDGSPIEVTAEVICESEKDSQSKRVQLHLDFTGTGPVSQSNLNANEAIVTAAVMYVLRVLVGENIPLNQGVLSAVKITLPQCLLNPAEGPTSRSSPAVVGGNVETSQRVVDVLLGALGLAAASQGTMNNLLFGNDQFGYYETICGGSGATAEGPGVDAVHTHMTNTRLTDPEVLEQRFPVRLLEFSIRHGSGGQGRHAGGNGVRRRLQFLTSLRVSLLTQRRGPFPPYGMQGGESGALGRNL